MIMKIATTIEQSKKLAEILPIESADMCWFRGDTETPKIYSKDMMKDSMSVTLPCWSLAALLEQFEDTSGLAREYGLWFCYDNRKSYCTKHHDNPVDACYEMIIKLKEENIL